MSVRKAREPELVGAAEAALILGVRQNNLHGRNEPAGMPTPYQHVRATRLWRKAEIVRFAEVLEARRAARRAHADGPVRTTTTTTTPKGDA